MWTPDFVASLKLQGNFEFCSLSIDANYVGIRYKTNLNLGYLPPYVLLNLTGEVLNLKYFTPYFSYKFSWSLTKYALSNPTRFR